jgi:hypothetical protein
LSGLFVRRFYHGRAARPLAARGERVYDRAGEEGTVSGGAVATEETIRLSWSRVYREAELYKAAVRLYTKPLFRWRKALSRSTDERTLYDFARKGLRNLDHLHRALAAGRFHFRPGLALHHNFNGKARTLYVYPWEERLVDLLLYRVLCRRLHDWFSPSAYAYRLNGWGVDRCQRRVARTIARARGPLYVIKRDIADYFASVDHATLLGQLRELVAPDDYLFELLAERVRFRYADDGQVCTAARGIPFGTAIACLFANVYLTALDRRLEAVPGLACFRYADDLLVLSEDRAAAGEALCAVREGLAALKLASKESHEQSLALSTVPVSDNGFAGARRFRHLGLEFRADGTVGLSRDKQRKIRNLFRYAFRRRRGRLRRLTDPRKRAALAVETARGVLEQGLRNVAIIDYYLKHVEDEAQWRQLDRWLAEEVLAVAFGNGHRKGNFRRLSFRALRAMGLPSLVHRRRLIRHGHLASPFFVWKNHQQEKRSGRTAARPHARSQDPATRPSLRAQQQQPVHTS